MKKQLSHVSSKGEIRMVDISAKTVTLRRAVAEARMTLTDAISTAIRSNAIAKGNVFETARLAGILGAKKTPELIPLCHQIPLTDVQIAFDLQGNELRIESIAEAEAKTGVEMEALTAVSVAALAVYDMCKGIDKGMIIGPVELVEKSGGKSGLYQRRMQLRNRIKSK